MSKNRFKITAGSDKVRGIPTRLIPDVAHALIEDAMLSEAADIAATIAESTVQPAAIVVPENDIEREILGLAGIPYLGPTRLKALADIGIVTFEQLHKSSCEEIASGRGIGQYNARKVRDWLDNLPSAPAVVADQSAEENRDRTTHEFAAENQQIQDDLAAIDNAMSQLIVKLPENNVTTGLLKQLARTQVLLGELPESMDTVPFARQLELVEVLDGISDSLLEATSRTRLGAKKQEELRVRMRKMRRRLGKLLGC